jgi:hypothetical protein
VKPDLPPDLVNYLADPANRRLDSPGGGEIEAVIFYSVDELTERSFSYRSYPRGAGNDHEVRGVDLVKSCVGYAASGIMVWFPGLHAYGQYDDDHHHIIFFPTIHWTALMRSPEKYFNGQWHPERVSHQYLRTGVADRTKNPDREPQDDQPRLPGF